MATIAGVGAAASSASRRLQLPGFEAAAVLAGDGRVDDDQPQRAEVDGVVERRVALAGRRGRAPRASSPGRRGCRAARTSATPSLPISFCARRYSFGFACSARSPETRIASGRSGSALSALTTVAQAGLGLGAVARALAEVEVGDLGEEEGAAQGADPRWSGAGRAPAGAGRGRGGPAPEGGTDRSAVAGRTGVAAARRRDAAISAATRQAAAVSEMAGSWRTAEGSGGRRGRSV